MSVDGLVSLYDSTFTGLLDKHCPLVTVRHKVHPMTPWFDAECRQLDDVSAPLSDGINVYFSRLTSDHGQVLNAPD